MWAENITVTFRRTQFSHHPRFQGLHSQQASVYDGLVTRQVVLQFWDICAFGRGGSAQWGYASRRGNGQCMQQLDLSVRQRF